MHSGKNISLPTYRSSELSHVCHDFPVLSSRLYAGYVYRVLGVFMPTLTFTVRQCCGNWDKHRKFHPQASRNRIYNAGELFSSAVVFHQGSCFFHIFILLDRISVRHPCLEASECANDANCATLCHRCCYTK